MLKIKSSDIPEIDEYTKELVNDGHYALHTLNKYGGAYLLVTPDKDYILDINGQILFDDKDVRDDVILPVLFSDIKMPPSTSDIYNMKDF